MLQPRVTGIDGVTLAIFLCAMVSVTALAGCWGKADTKVIPPPPDPRPKAIIKTRFGEMEMKFYPDLAPKHVENFIKLAKSGFYNGTIFHRVIPGFMIQGGDPYSKTGKGPVGTGGPGYTIKCETEKNTHKHVAGTLSMAHAGKNTGGSQFFICHAPQRHLDGVHTVFGQVTKGMDVVNAIKQNDEIKSIRVS